MIGTFKKLSYGKKLSLTSLVLKKRVRVANKANQRSHLKGVISQRE